jgi:chromosome partitioning protein
MLSVLVGNIKGGCGKTTIATHLAAAFAGQGFKTVIGDCDRQRSSLNWLRRRKPSLPAIAGLDWSKAVDEPSKDTQRLVIDAPAAMRHKAVEELILLADVVVVPVLPGAFDEDATAHFLAKLAEVKVVRKNKRVVAVVGNRLRLGTKASAHLDTFFGGLGFPVVARLRDSQIYPGLAAEGASLMDSTLRRAKEYLPEWQPLLDLVKGT